MRLVSIRCCACRTRMPRKAAMACAPYSQSVGLSVGLSVIGGVLHVVPMLHLMLHGLAGTHGGMADLRGFYGLGGGWKMAKKIAARRRRVFEGVHFLADD